MNLTAIRDDLDDAWFHTPTRAADEAKRIEQAIDAIAPHAKEARLAEVGRSMEIEQSETRFILPKGLYAWSGATWIRFGVVPEVTLPESFANEVGAAIPAMVAERVLEVLQKEDYKELPIDPFGLAHTIADQLVQSIPQWTGICREALLSAIMESAKVRRGKAPDPEETNAILMQTPLEPGWKY